jgi:hypothetical protein
MNLVGGCKRIAGTTRVGRMVKNAGRMVKNAVRKPTFDVRQILCCAIYIRRMTKRLFAVHFL